MNGIPVRDLLLDNPRFSPFISDLRILPGRGAEYAEPPHFTGITAWFLEKQGLKLYTHQAETVEAVCSGEDVILSTPTASGKTYAFFLPFVEMRAENPGVTALALYPAKALTRDQMKALLDIERVSGVNLNPAIYDGDVPSSVRPGIRENAGIVLTNPYELHQILPWHRQWSRFFRSLRYVIIDEAHQFRGVFGSHVALLIRRLRRIAAYYGSDPIFILSSATLANPTSFAASLTGKKCRFIGKSGAPSGDRMIVLYNPYQLGFTERTPSSEAALLLASLVESGHQTLCFTGSRKMTELIASWARGRITGKNRNYQPVVAYRAGYLPEERKAIESRVKSGEIRGIVSTNALELGIDIGTLDAVVMTGYPGTIMSVWQQAGRAGRTGKESVAILIGFHSPLDQYFMRNPSIFFERPPEHAFVNPDNPYILSGQILCAGAELPLQAGDSRWFGDTLTDHLSSLSGEHLLTSTPRGFVYSGLKRATELISLSETGENWTLETKGKVLETLTQDQACREAHEGAVFVHQGETYLVRRWAADQQRIFADREDVPYHTRADHSEQVRIIEAQETRSVPGGTLTLGSVEVTGIYTGYRKILDGVTIGQEPLDIPPTSYQTIAIWWIPESGVCESVTRSGGDLAGSLHGAEHLLISMMPWHLLCDRRDIGGLSTVMSDQTGTPVIFIYDGYEGGTGLCEASYPLFERIGGSAFDAVDRCPCSEGCPACIHSPKCGNDNQPLDKKGTALLLSLYQDAENPDIMHPGSSLRAPSPCNE